MTEKFTNKLIHESSPYLLQHAHNPVQWYPWGEEALNKAKELNPNDKELYVSLALTNFKLNNKKEACNYLNEAKSRGSSSAEELILIMCK